MSTIFMNRVWKYMAFITLFFLGIATSLYAQNRDQQGSVATVQKDDERSSSDQSPPAASPQNAKPDSQADANRNSPASPLPGYKFPSSSERFHSYLKLAFGPGTILISGISGAVAQGKNNPPEWGQGAEAYAQRFGSAFGERLMSVTTTYGLGEVLHQDTAYQKCDCTGVLNRFGHALKETYVSRTSSGRIVPSVPVLVGPYAGGVAGVYAWYPGRFGWKDGIREGTAILITRPLLSILREFLR